MRLVAVTLVALHVVAGCSHARPARAPAASALREGPVVVRVELLAGADAQRRHLGQPLDPRLLSRVLPVALSVENVGPRALVVLPSDVVLETPIGERRWAMHADALARVFDDTLSELDTPPPLSRRLRLEEYPALKLSFDVGGLICLATLFGCVLLLPPALVGVAIETSRAVGDRLRNAEGRAAVHAVQRRADALATVDGVGLAPGQTVRGIVYFPAFASETGPPRPPALIVRFTDRASGELAIVVRLDLAAPSAR